MIEGNPLSDNTPRNDSPRRGEGPSSVSPELDELSCALLGEALDALAAGMELSSVVAVEDSDRTATSRAFENDGPEACLLAARDYVRKLARDGGEAESGMGSPVRYAIVYDGDVADERGAYAPALILEFGEKGSSTAYSAFVLYDGVGAGEGFSWSDPEAAGEEDLLL